MPYKNPFIPNVHFELIPISNLVSNQVYQRSLSMPHVKKTVEHFDPKQINPVKVSRRDGINYVFNGQHTIEIIATVSGSRETPVWCMVYEDLDYETEADIFANQQKFVKILSPYEIFIANVEAGNDEQILIKNLVESYGLEVCHGKQPGGICCVSTLEAIYEQFGYHVLERTLKILIGTWEGDPLSLSANFLRGVAKLVVAFEDKLDDDYFKEKLGKESLRELSRNAKERKAGSTGYAEAMIIIYNKKNIAHALPWIELYKKKFIKKKSPEAELYLEQEAAQEDLTDTRQITFEDSAVS